jgi:hypothetical protein
MFASQLPRWTAGLRRAAALVKAFALLEDAPRSAAPERQRRALAQLPPLALDPRGGAPEHDRHAARAHPHRRALTHVRMRRDGAVPARPAACTMPIAAPRGVEARGATAQNARWAAQRAAHR